MSDETPPDVAPLRAGDELGKYVIKWVLGQGGFAVTYLAWDKEEQCEVVIKENLPSIFAIRDSGSCTVNPRSVGVTAEYTRTLEGFLREAKLLAALNHRNIVQVKSAFEALGTAYYVMPWVGGRSLEYCLATEGSMPAARLQRILVSMLDALSYLHHRKLLHMDIKPGNILLVQEDQPVLIDFGAACALSRHAHRILVETPGYTPEEQLRENGDIGPWTDIYALGATIYCMLMGKPPLPVSQRLAAHADSQPRLMEQSAFQGKVSRRFLFSVDKALAVYKENRWHNAEEWLSYLKRDSMAPVLPKASRVQESVNRRFGAGKDGGSAAPTAKRSSIIPIVWGIFCFIVLVIVLTKVLSYSTN